MIQKRVLKFKIPTWNCLTSTRKRGEMIELFLWVLLFGIFFYTYLPQLGSLLSPSYILFPSFNSMKILKSLSQPIARKQLTMQFVVLIPTKDASKITVLAENAKNFVVPENYRVPNGFQETIFDKDFSTNIENIMGNGATDDVAYNQLSITCYAPYPIEIIYEGNGRPRFGTITVEKKFADTISDPMYVVRLDFQKNKLEEMDSGIYTCQSIKFRDFDHSSHDFLGKIRHSMNLYVPGDMKLLHPSLQEPNGMLNSSDNRISVYHDVAVHGKHISLRCGISDPAIKVSLYKKETDGDQLILVEYDACSGFKIPLNFVTDSTGKLTNNNNIFICKTDGLSRQLAFKIILKDAGNSHFSPTSSKVAISNEQIPIQLFSCEAEEPIIIKWLDGPAPITLNEITTGEKYKVSFIATPTHLSSSEDSLTRFECSRQRDGMIIHIWEWTGNGVLSKPHLSYSGKRKELSCCTNSVYAPQLLVETCSTMLECQVKASFQPKISSAGKGKSNGGCSVWTVPTSFQTGVIMCNQVNSNPFSGQNKEFPPVFVKWNDDGRSSQPLESLISIKASKPTGNERMLQDDTWSRIKVECTASSMMFAMGFRWTMYGQNNTVFKNVQANNAWGTDGVIAYEEQYDPVHCLYRGVLWLSWKAYVKPHLEIGNVDGAKATLNLSNSITKLVCEVPIWNDTNVWITSELNKFF